MAAIIPRLFPISKTVSLTKLVETRGDLQHKTRWRPHPTQLAPLKSRISNQELLLKQKSKTGAITNFSFRQFMRLKQQVNWVRLYVEYVYNFRQIIFAILWTWPFSIYETKLKGKNQQPKNSRVSSTSRGPLFNHNEESPISLRHLVPCGFTF